MRMGETLKRFMIFTWILALITGIFLLPAAPARAEETPKVVRVGWYNSSFCYWDEFGRRCGIDYEYQHRIAAYTGWTYEYVEDSWPNLLQKLMDGDIDLLSDVSYREERAEFISYPDLPMGTESYYIYISSGNRELSGDKPATFDGKKIGVNKGSVQEGFLKTWAEKNGITVEIVPLTAEEEICMNMVRDGRLDGFASVYTLSAEENTIPVCRIGGSDYYYAVNKNRPDLLAELNTALAGIHEEDPYFNERLSEERLQNSRLYVALTPAQETWLEEHSTIRVGYVENWMPFCQTDPETGELTGALKDFLAHARNSLSQKQEVRFVTTSYASAAAALEALNKGAVDCVFPVSMNYYDADQQKVWITNPAMKTGVNEVLRDSDERSLSRDGRMTIAVTAGNVNVDTFIKEQYPACRVLTYPDDQACYAAIQAGTADCTLISNYRIPSREDVFKKYRLYSVPTGEHIHFSFAVRKADRDLYFLLNRAVLMTDSGIMDSALASYMRTREKVGFAEFLQDNWLIVLAFLVLVFAAIITLLLLRLKAQRKANAQKKLLEEAAEVAELKNTITSLLDNMPGMTFTKDAETGVYLACNQAFAEYANRKKPEEVTGHTDTELFDPETANRLAMDDKLALSMDGPYVFFEDAEDDSGSKRHVKVTKLKYTDAAGRLCVLGISQDVSDSFHIRRGSVVNKEGYEKARGAGIIYTHIAQALAKGYEDLYYIDVNTEQFIEYSPDAEGGGLTEVRRGWHFFEECRDDAEQRIHPEDAEAVIKALDRKTLLAELEKNRSIRLTYRLNGENGPRYVTLKATRVRDDDRYIVLGVTDIDEQVRQSEAAMKAAQEQVAYNRLKALEGDYLCIYIIDPENGRFREFSSAEGYEAAFSQVKEGVGFFTAVREGIRTYCHPDDLNRVLAAVTEENVMAEIEKEGIFTVSYRLMVNGNPRYVRLKAALVEEEEGRRIMVGVNDIDAQVRQEERFMNHLAQAQIEANIDALTGVKNRHAYLMAEERLNAQIAEDPEKEFSVAILDVNDLKTVNDRDGHNAGDQYLKEACRIICNVFEHSPVFRVGGDEFAVISQGEDYGRIDELVREMARLNEEALKSGGVVIACGMARRCNEDTVAPVFERADHRMYENKNELKSR